MIDDDRRLVGVVTRGALERWLAYASDHHAMVEIMEPSPVVATDDEPLRAVVHRMAETGLTRLPVVDNSPEPRLVGMVSLTDLLKGRRRTRDAEQRRERVFSLRVALPFRRRAGVGT